MYSLWFPQIRVTPDPPLLEVLALGAAVLVGVNLAHGSGLGYIVRSYRRGAKHLLQEATHPWRASVVFSWAVLLMLILHIVDTCIWTVIIHRIGLIPDFRTCLYFSANSYTTLGLSTVPLGLGWRELSPIMGISGLFTFAWTTSVMFNVVGYHHDLVDELHEEYSRKKQMRANLRLETATIGKHELQEASEETAKERQQERGKTFFERLRMRREARKERHLLRNRAGTQVEEALHDEREAEKHLYQPPSNQGPNL